MFAYRFDYCFNPDFPNRSPWSGEYQAINAGDKVQGGGYKPSAALAQQEASFNEAFSVYRDLYFGGGVSSVYLWDLDVGFAGSILIKKGTDFCTWKIAALFPFQLHYPACFDMIAQPYYHVTARK